MQTINNNLPNSETKIMTNLTSHYLKKHEDLVIHIRPKIKNKKNVLLNVLSFCGTKYDQFYNKYDWDTIEKMFGCYMYNSNELEFELVNSLNQCIALNEDDDEEGIDRIDYVIHFLKKFRKFQSVIPVFYPNIAIDFKEHTYFNDDRYFDWASWFLYNNRLSKGPIGFDDIYTDYKIIRKMFTQILKHFDYWYWNYYDGDNVVETSLVEDIVDIYKTLEEFYFADKNMTAEEIDETIKKASPDDPGYL